MLRSNRWKGPALGALAFEWTLCAGVMPAQATEFLVVDSTADAVDANPGDGVCRTAAGTCTLRAAMMEANHVVPAGEMIAVSIQIGAGTYRLSLPPDGVDDESDGDLNFSSAVGETIELVGAGSTATIIDAARIDRVFHVEPGRVADIRNIGITGGLTAGPGGGIWNEGGSLTLTDVAITGNAASGGGGIYNTQVSGQTGSAALLRTRVAGNAVGDGGIGGGISSTQPLTAFESTVEHNTAPVGAGGGVYSVGDLQIANSTVAFNLAGNGGGVYVTSSNAIFINATVVGNEATDNGGGFYYSAFDALYALNVYNSTIAYNDANQDRDPTGAGGGVFVDNANGDAINLYNSILAGNYQDNSPQPGDCFGRLRTHAQNRVGDATGCDIVQISGQWALLNSLDLLGSPAMNGGPTATVALLAGSNAIDAADPTFGCLDKDSNPILFDQRGFARGSLGACDLGAYEFGAINPDDAIFADGFDS